MSARAFDAQNLITIPHAKLLRTWGTLSGPQLAAVEAVVRSWLGVSAAEVQPALQPTGAGRVIIAVARAAER